MTTTMRRRTWTVITFTTRQFAEQYASSLRGSFGVVGVRFVGPRNPLRRSWVVDILR